MTPGSAVRTASGANLRLGQVLGKGGEGTIFHVEGDPSLALKIYTDGKQLERLPKLQAMIANKLSSRTALVSFPLDTAHTNSGFVGFTMRKAVGSKPMFNLCISSDRKNEFPDANYRFLVRVALNYARAIASLHSLGAVVGDINESGALVDQKGLVTLIDSDSFQYAASGTTYRCLVGKGEYTPPELQGRQLGSIDRTTNHDAFGLAVILFEILFLGRHPFSGIPQGRDHPTISEAIAAGRFAYSPHKTVTNMEPPKHMPVLTDLPPDVAVAFQRAFGPHLGSKPQSRPTAAEWVTLLEAMEKNVVECKVNPAHYHSRSAATCPWCRFEAGYATVLFVHHRTIRPTTFDLEQILSRIGAIVGPGPAPDLASLMSGLPKPGPSQAAKAVKRRSIERKLAGLVGAAISLFLMLSGMAWGFLILIPSGFFFFGEQSGKNDIIQRRAKAERDWQSAKEDWSKNAGMGRFDVKKYALERAGISYRALPGIERDMLVALEKRKQDLQLQKHLESQKITRATIDSIGDSRKLTLRSFGIETAWDIKHHAVMAIPGFGPGLTKKLTDWRKTVERRFKFNPAVPTDPAEIAKVNNEISMRRSALETELLKGVQELETIKAEALANRRNARPHQSAYLAFLEAEEDHRLLG